MALSRDQIVKIQENPVNKATISKAVKNELRLRFHVDTNMEPGEARTVYNDFINWVQGILPRDKFNIFLHLLQFPISTNDLTEEIFTDLEKVYDAKDAYEEYNFKSPEALDDWLEYKEQELKAGEFWRHKAWEKYKTQFNGFIVVDLHREQTTEKPEPYFYFLPIDKAADFDYDPETGEIEWIMIPQKDETIAFIDQDSYRIFETTEEGMIKGEAIVDNPHDLGRCPAAFFWHEALKQDQPALKKSVLSNQQTNLDWLLFFQTSKKHLDLYAPYPIYSGFEQECDYNTDAGDYCEGGFIKDASDRYHIDRIGAVQKCPVCADKRLAGVGSFIEVPLPSDENNNADLRNPVQITTIDRDSLDYNVEECQRLEKLIKQKVTGGSNETTLNKSFNEDQIRSQLEGKRNVLLSLKKNLERIQEWTEDTICRLRYGEYYVGNQIEKGTDWYLQSTEELATQYKTAKEGGASDYELDLIQDQIIETENRNNPAGMKRANILKHLEPYRHQTRQEVLDMLSKGFGDRELIAVKLNFSTFVLRFERENTDILEFGSALPFHSKIETITKILKNYGREQINPSEGQQREPAAV